MNNFDENHSVRNDENHSVRNDENHSVRNDENHSVRNDENHSVNAFFVLYHPQPIIKLIKKNRLPYPKTICLHNGPYQNVRNQNASIYPK